jgi:hypothetical protein
LCIEKKIMQGTGNDLRKRKKCISNYDNQRRPFEDSYAILSFFPQKNFPARERRGQSQRSKNTVSR